MPHACTGTGLTGSPSGISQGRDVQPADSSGAPCGGPVLYAYTPQVLCQVPKDLCGIWPSPDTRRVGLGLHRIPDMVTSSLNATLWRTLQNFV